MNRRRDDFDIAALDTRGSSFLHPGRRFGGG